MEINMNDDMEAIMGEDEHGAPPVGWIDPWASTSSTFKIKGSKLCIWSIDTYDLEIDSKGTGVYIVSGV